MASTGLTNAEQSHKTRRALLDTARAIFTEQGYSAATDRGDRTTGRGDARGVLLSLPQ